MIKPATIKPEDFFLTGAAETSLVYLATPFIAGAASVQDIGMFLFEDGFGTGYVGKKGSTATKDEWIALESQELQNLFLSWQNKWRDIDDELYSFATQGEPSIWRSTWKRVDEINYDFWFDSYKLDCLDPFAEELEQEVLKGLAQANVDTELFSEIISPSELTLPQQMEVLLSDVADKKLSEVEYIRRFWFKKGTWNGGAVYMDDDLQQEVAAKVSPDQLQQSLARRMQLHKDVDVLLDEYTLRLVILLRIFTLWRELRKSFAQRFCLVLKHITADAASDLGVDVKLVRWAQIDEIDNIIRDQNALQERMLKSVYIMKDGTQTVFLDDEAQQVFDAFVHKGEEAHVKGMVAAKGNARGIVRIV
ncbi:MAG: hypothetical protein ABIP54_00090, partial [Candidatus Andersenbacteria bacterium]